MPLFKYPPHPQPQKKSVCLVWYSSNLVSKLKNKNKNYSYSHFFFICYQPILKTFQLSIHLGFTGYHSFFSHPLWTPVLTGYLLLKHLILPEFSLVSIMLFVLSWVDATQISASHLIRQNGGTISSASALGQVSGIHTAGTHCPLGT